MRMKLCNIAQVFGGGYRLRVDDPEGCLLSGLWGEQGNRLVDAFCPLYICLEIVVEQNIQRMPQYFADAGACRGAKVFP